MEDVESQRRVAWRAQKAHWMSLAVFGPGRLHSSSSCHTWRTRVAMGEGGAGQQGKRRMWWSRDEVHMKVVLETGN